MQELSGLFSTFRVLVLGDQEIVHGLLVPTLSPDDPQVTEFTGRWPGPFWVRETPAGPELVLVRRALPRRRERWWLHALLLALTLLATTLSGALIAGADPLRLVPLPVLGVDLPLPTGFSAPDLAPGLWFSLPLVAVLLAHELGHYFAARYHGMDASPPYFVPAPFFLNLIGTFGAFIRLRSPLLNRRVLLDVGAAGPVAGFALAVPVLAAGLWMSALHPVPPGWTGPALGIVVGDELQLPLGESLGIRLLRLLSPVSGPGVVGLHPTAFAGWVGFFFTALNLIPVYQLDGGHVLYALFGGRQRAVALAFTLLLLVLGWFWWGWWLWAGIILLIGRGRVGHPPVFDPLPGVGGVRRAVGWLCVLIFLLTFAPIPFPL